ncbi:hypothetical protein F4782DRAFT_548583 [Xylaria castorea]|nr:hypothetical protein F4782DRAFT_548583 [Xylaria castorea]
MNITKLLKKLTGKSTGWKMAAKVNCAILTTASVTLVGLSIAAASTKSWNIIFILSGNCDENLISAANVALHLLINILSTLVVLNAPSREELDCAHSKGSWLGIGVPSVRNGFLVSKFKTWCWIALLISSMPIHLLFNSIIFETDYRGSDFHLTIGTEEFVHNGPYFPPGASLFSGQEIHALSLRNNRTSPEIIEEGIWGYGTSVNDMDAIQNLFKAAKQGSNWTKIDSRECWETYINCEELKIYRDLVVVVDQPEGWTRKDMWQLSTDQSLSWDRFVPSDKPNHLFYHARCAMLEEFGGHNQRRPGLQPDASDLSIKYCLAETPERICHIALLPTLLLAVTAAIVAKTVIALTLTVILNRRNQPPLVTLGDAIASFIEKPDAVTVGFCTLNQSDFKKLLGSDDILLPGPRRWQARQERRLAAVPRSVWLSSYLLFVISISIAAYLFKSSNFLPSDKNPSLYTGRDMTLTQSILLANSPQLLLSFCYLAYNNLFTRMQMAKEWAMFTTAYHPLRVTDPQGEQFATYRLQLPYKYSLPLIAISIALHWLLSNTIYVFVSIGVDPSLPPNTGIAVQFSESALLALIVASIALICVPILLGLKRLPADSINCGSNSLALSAVCHSSTLVYKSGNATKISEHITEPLSPQPLVPLSPPLSTARNGSGEENYSYGINTNASMITIGTQIWAASEGSDLSFSRDSLTSEQATNELESEREQTERSLRILAQRKIRWGVVKMSPGWYTEYADDGLVEHLGFGTEEDMVSSPVSGNSYA